MKQTVASPIIAEKQLFRIGFLVLIIIAIGLRLSLIKFQSYDYQYYLAPWYAYIHTHGFHSFRDGFSNYNLPYLYLLYIANFLHVPTIWAIKLISCLSDALLAYGTFLLVRYYRNSFKLAALAAISVLFLPTVFLNSAAWGQCDSIYCSFVLFSLYAAVRDKALASWVWWAVAFCFKLQAIFFLPFLVFLWLITRSKRWWYPLVAVPIFLVPFVPAMIAGRSFTSIASIYLTQANGKPQLTLNAPNLYQWLGSGYDALLNRAGVLFAAGIITLLLLGAVAYRQRLTDRNLLAFALLCLLVVPYVLPQMHERYFYPAEIVALITGFTFPRYAWLAAIVELAGLFAYLPFLFRVAPPLPLSVVALVQLFSIGVVVYLAFYRVTAPVHLPPKRRIKNT